MPAEHTFADASALLPLDARQPGAVLLVLEALSAEDALTVLLACANAAAGWEVSVLDRRDPGYALPVRFGQPRGFGESAAGSPNAAGETLTAAQLVDHVRKTRHDINNPLGAALVEVQLLLMDVRDAAVVRSLETVQEQLRRIKELLAGLIPKSMMAGGGRG